MKIRWIAICAAAAVMPVLADQTHLAGTWKGSAEKSVCGQPAGSEEIILILQDKGYQPIAGTQPFGDLSGDLVVGSARDGVVALRYDAKSAKASSFIGSVRQLNGLAGQKSSPFATYWIDLQAADAWKGVGIYQTLQGSLARSNYACPNLGTHGEVLTVRLKKQ
jgi:hypothetical protein